MQFSIKVDEGFGIDIDAYVDNLDPKIHRELGHYFSKFEDGYEEELPYDCLKTYYKLTKQIYGGKS